MSFILDALKKSESERQRQASPTLADVARPAEKQKMPTWLWVLGVLLIFNIAVLLGIYFRPAPVAEMPPALVLTDNPQPGAAIATAPEPATTRPVATENQTTPAAAQELPQPAREEARPLAAEAATTTNAVASGQEPQVTTAAAVPQDTGSAYDAYPTYATLLADGSIQGRDLHIDIHVYSDVAADRFVFINMNKYREGQQLTEGPNLIAITTDGVILQQGAYRFLLPRE